MSRPPNTDTLSTIHRAFDVIDALRELEGARVTELADHLELAPSTTHKYLATLEAEGCAVKEGDEYHIGMEFLDIGTYAKRVQFVIEEHGLGIYLHTEASDENAVMIDRRDGVHRHLHSTAAGKAILAELPASRIDEIIAEHEMPAETDQTIVDRASLDAELDRIREAGVSYNDEESVEGLRAVGVPVFRPDGVVLGAFSVSGPTNRLKADQFREELPSLLLGHANEIELNLSEPNF